MMPTTLPPFSRASPKSKKTSIRLSADSKSQSHGPNSKTQNPYHPSLVATHTVQIPTNSNSGNRKPNSVHGTQQPNKSCLKNPTNSKTCFVLNFPLKTGSYMSKRINDLPRSPTTETSSTSNSISRARISSIPDRKST